jgi:hypothetical protein
MIGTEGSQSNERDFSPGHCAARGRKGGGAHNGTQFNAVTMRGGMERVDFCMDNFNIFL